MRRVTSKIAKEFLNRDIIDIIIDDYIIKERLVGTVPLTIQLKRESKS